MMPQMPPKFKYMPHKVLLNNATYLVLEDGNVLKVVVTMGKVMKGFDADGKPALYPTGEPIYNVSNTITVIMLSKEEWLVERELIKRGE